MTSANERLTQLNRDYIMDMAKRKRLESNRPQNPKPTDSYEYDDIDSWKSDKLTRLREVREKRKEYLGKGSGTLELLTDEKALVEATKRFHRVVCHFYEDGFVRCDRLDGLLANLASSFVDTKFVKIRASNSPFFTMKFGIKVLPTLLTIIDGSVSKIFVGFQEFSGDNINLNILRSTLFSHKILTNECCIISSDSDGDE